MVQIIGGKPFLTVKEIRQELRDSSLRFGEQLVRDGLVVPALDNYFLRAFSEDLVPMHDYEAWLERNPDKLKRVEPRGIYSITCIKNGSVYVGQSRYIWRRWICHQRDLRKGAHFTERLQADWDRYGAEAFALGLIELLPRTADFCHAENFWMEIYRRRDVLLYNKPPMLFGRPRHHPNRTSNHDWA